MDNLFDFIRKYSLQFRSEVPDNLICTICGNILIDTHYSHCGCKFCKECIENYLPDGDKPCPSRKETCTDVILSLSKDVKKDSYSDTQIGNLLVTCPFDLCNHRCVMKMMPDHVRTCSKQPTVCDFSTVGCEEIMAGEEGLENHLANASVNHLRLLLAYLSNSGNDTQQQMDSLKRQLVDEQRSVNEMRGNMEREITAIKDVAKTNSWWMSFMIFAIAILFIALMISISRRVDTNETNIRIEIQQLKEKILSFQEQIDTKERNISTEMQQLKATIDSVSQRVTAKGTNLRTKMPEDIQQLKEKFLSVQEQIDTKERNISTEMQQLKATIDSVSQQMEITERNIRMEIQQEKERVKYSGFDWRVFDLTKKRRNNEKLLSDYFYSHPNGYRMRLFLFPNGYDIGKGTHLSLGFHIVKGQFDDTLKWPMTKRVWLAIVNKQTGSDYVKINIHIKDEDPAVAYHFEKPRDMNPEYGRPQFIDWAHLQKVSDVLSNDVLLIRCTFTDW